MTKTRGYFILTIILVVVSMLFIGLGPKGNISNTLQAKDLKDLKIPEISGLQGGYLPKNEIIIGNYKFACIIINTNSHNKIEEILFQIKDKDEKSFAKFFTCKDFVLNSNKLILKPTTTQIGSISFEGSFLPVENGNYMDVTYNTIVLKGKLTITKAGKKLYFNKNQQFTFLFGD